MNFYNREEAKQRMNDLAEQAVPFLFIIDYEAKRAVVEPESEVDANELKYCFNGIGNATQTSHPTNNDIEWRIEPPTEAEYQHSFNIVRNAMLAGNSYLANLTCRVGLQTNLSLLDLYHAANAHYRLWMKDKLVCFSPETFVKISQGKISSYPMKGTAEDVSPLSAEQLLANEKEAAEHATIVDLIRNDLSMVASNVRVERYRYVERLNTHRGPLLQTSSEIKGQLMPHLMQRPGDVIFSQLPAGSITGAPKKKTVEIIAEAENYHRDFYTGVMGRWDNGELDSAVMIRFIDQHDGKLYFKAGGGITAKSNWKDEYHEVIEKVYAPICRNHQD
ncbi:para-aminobenzoate synthase component I [Prevotella sp. oral taxon 472 str. F0295]|nr:aminodeoxychorismate synthase component I [Prevotella sp. oral taxon 472]EEX51703.1 para-aminobenzoate synthase component I [Prevotella sp. oral taxon 472 str. F0295]